MHPSEAVSRNQRAYRERVVATWPLEPGAAVLEVGCGQGDMTAVLAEAVGPDGRIVAVDSAPQSYGSPMTLGEATDLIKASTAGSRVEFRFDFDILTEQLEEEFDFAVLAHASWYFASRDQLSTTLRHLRRVSKRLCFAEWDLVPPTLAQVPHMLAAMIQGEAHALSAGTEANVRTPLSRSQAVGLIVESGWRIVAETTVDSSSLEDADWEIAMCTSAVAYEGTPIADLVGAQIGVLNRLALEQGNPSLNSYSVVAEA